MNISKILWIVVTLVAIGVVGLSAYALNLKYNIPAQSTQGNLTNETLKGIQTIPDSSANTTASKSENYTPQQQEMIKQLSKASAKAKANAQKYASTKIVNFANLFSLELPYDATAFGGEDLDSVKDSIKKSGVDVVFCETNTGCSEGGNMISLSVFNSEGKTLTSFHNELSNTSFKTNILKINNQDILLTGARTGYEDAINGGIINLHFFTRNYIGVFVIFGKDFESLYNQILNKTHPEYSPVLNSLKIIE